MPEVYKNTFESIPFRLTTTSITIEIFIVAQKLLIGYWKNHCIDLDLASAPG